MGFFLAWVAAVIGTLAGIARLNAREVRAAERATGARCAIVWESGAPSDVAPHLYQGETLRPPLYWFGAHQIACVPRRRGDGARLAAIRAAADRAYWDRICPVFGYYEPRCGQR